MSAISDAFPAGDIDLGGWFQAGWEYGAFPENSGPDVEREMATEELAIAEETIEGYEEAFWHLVEQIAGGEMIDPEQLTPEQLEVQDLQLRAYIAGITARLRKSAGMRW